MAWKPGQSGNPAGRPKDKKPYIEWCREWTIFNAKKHLVPIAENPEHKHQLEAIKLLMAYGVGKPLETSIVEAEIAPRTGTSVEEIAGEIASILGEPEGSGSGKDIQA